jgi:hypothetical protein
MCNNPSWLMKCILPNVVFLFSCTGYWVVESIISDMNARRDRHRRGKDANCHNSGSPCFIKKKLKIISI